MKRKAMAMGMAVMAGLPSWAMAKGSAAKVADGVHSYADGMELPDATAQPAADTPSLSNDIADENGSANKAAILLAQIKSMLRRSNYGMAAKPAADNLGWKLEMMQANALTYAGPAYDLGDARLLDANPVGVTFRFKF